MKINPGNSIRISLLITLLMSLILLSTRMRADTGACDGTSITLPFTDVTSGNVFFCSIAEAYLSGLTNGFTSTTYNPSANVPREQMAAFITRTMDQSLKRGSRRAALNQFWTSTSNAIQFTFFGGAGPLRLVQSDGADMWVAGFGESKVYRVRASDGQYMAAWTGANNAFGVLVARGLVYVTGRTSPHGSLYSLDPSLTPTSVSTVTSNLGSNSAGIAFDGTRIWTANSAIGPGTGSVSFYSFSTLTPTTISTGFSQPLGILYDGANIWVTDIGDGTLKKLDSSGAVIQTVSVGGAPQFPAFDGANIWVPNVISDTVAVVRAGGALAGTVLANLSGNGLSSPRSAAFDGERILVTNGGGNLSLWKASDISQIAFTFSAASPDPFGVYSDGLNLWIALTTVGSPALARF